MKSKRLGRGLGRGGGGGVNSRKKEDMDFLADF